MIVEELDIAKEIFSLLGEGIVDGYDSFEYIVEVHEGYMEEELDVTLDGRASSDIKKDYNAAKLHDLVTRLKQKALSRGDDWKKFILSYVQGEEVKLNFEYS